MAEQELNEAKELTATSQELLEKVYQKVEEAKQASGAERAKLEKEAQDLFRQAQRLTGVAERLVKKSAS